MIQRLVTWTGNFSYHMWMSNVGLVSSFLSLVLVGGTCEWIMCALRRHIWMHHVSYEWVMTHSNESCLIWMRSVWYEWVVFHTSASYLDIKESCLDFSYFRVTNCASTLGMPKKGKKKKKKRCSSCSTSLSSPDQGVPGGGAGSLPLRVEFYWKLKVGI